MCRRFCLDFFPETIFKTLDVGTHGHVHARTQIHPANEVGVAIYTEMGNCLASMTWGWERLSNTTPLINVRSAEAWDLNTWRTAIRKHRCIIPVSGFFEWDENQPKGMRDRYRINPTLEDGFALGGVYEVNSEGEMFMSILTTAPNKKMARINDQMPVMLDKEEFNDWFISDDSVHLERMMQPAHDDWIELVKET